MEGLGSGLGEKVGAGRGETPRGAPSQPGGEGPPEAGMLRPLQEDDMVPPVAALHGVKSRPLLLSLAWRPAAAASCRGKGG
jgi:hypothetical protein